MREGVVLLEFDHLGVDHDEAELVGGELEEEGGDDGVDADGFSGTGGAGDEDVGHLGEVGDDGEAVHVLAEGEGDAGLGLAPFIGLEEIAHDDLGLHGVGDFDTDGGFAGDGREDVEAFGLEGGGDVVGEAGDLLEFDPGCGVEFVAGDGGTLGDVAGSDLDAELGEGLDHEPGVGDELFLGFGGADGEVGEMEEVDGGKLIIPDHRGAGHGDGPWLADLHGAAGPEGGVTSAGCRVVGTRGQRDGIGSGQTDGTVGVRGLGGAQAGGDDGGIGIGLDGRVGFGFFGIGNGLGRGVAAEDDIGERA